MTKQEIQESYEIRNGVITSCGKFEGEAQYVPYFWDECMNGSADYDDGDVYGVVITDEDRQMWNDADLYQHHAILLEESEAGFVFGKLVDRAEWDRFTSL